MNSIVQEDRNETKGLASPESVHYTCSKPENNVSIMNYCCGLSGVVYSIITFVAQRHMGFYDAYEDNTYINKILRLLFILFA